MRHGLQHVAAGGGSGRMGSRGSCRRRGGAAAGGDVGRSGQMVQHLSQWGSLRGCCRDRQQGFGGHSDRRSKRA